MDLVTMVQHVRFSHWSSHSHWLPHARSATTWLPVAATKPLMSIAIRDSISFIGQWRLLSDHKFTDIFDETRLLPSPARQNTKANELSGWVGNGSGMGRTWMSWSAVLKKYKLIKNSP
ncbi:hypothetical protein B0H19DRAFT_1069416 [Mycena capillaripes]|nr:hypothetical protein B0H19DRAFT_1069416 [Mycena capillaripes]